ncbi:P-loop NTPase fold protein [Desulfurobacterium sp.]
MGNITKKEIEEYLENVLNMSRPIVVAIKGKWGTGKTFFINDFLHNRFEGKYVYVSLFGKSNINEVIQEIVLSLYSRNKLTRKLKGFLGLTGGAASYETEVKGISLNLTTSVIASLLSLAEKKDFKGIIVAIDDLERTQIDIDQVLGLISQLKEEKDCKVILIFNEEEIDGEYKEKYKQYKEKCIDVEILFNPSFGENFSLLKEIVREEQKESSQQEENFIFEIIRSYFKEIEERGYDEKNLRILTYIFYKLREITFIQGLNIDDYFEDSIFKTLTFLFYIKKRTSLAIASKKELKEYLSMQKSERVKKIARETAGVVKEKQESQEGSKDGFSDFKRLQPEDNILHLENEKFFSELLKFWESEIMTQQLRHSISESLKLYQEKIQSEEDLREKSEFINNVYRRYLTELHYSEDNFVKDTWKFLEENKELLLRIMDIWHLTFLLEKLIEFDPENKDKYLDFAEELFINYLHDRTKRNIEFLFEPDSEIYRVIKRLSELGIGSSILERYFDMFKAKYKEVLQALECEKFFGYLREIIKRNGWNFSDLEIINSIQKKRLKECFLKTRDLSLIVDFFRHRANSPNFENLKDILLEILDDLESQEKYKRKIQELRQNLIKS